MASLQELLQEAELDQYLDNFVAKGIDARNLITLTLQDYGSVGITAMGDRKKLFQLIQVIKNAQQEQLLSQPPAPSRQDELIKDHEAQRQALLEALPPTAAAPTAASPARPEKSVAAPVAQRARPSSASGNGSKQNSNSMSSVTRPVTSQDIDERELGLSRAIARKAPGVASVPLQPTAAVTASAQQSSSSLSRIRVAMRKRPLSRKEKDRKEGDIIEVTSRTALSIMEPRVKVDLTRYIETHSFHFDEVFDDALSNEAVYCRTAQPLVKLIFVEQAKATCFAYGQTGAGKTHTMMGKGVDVLGLYALAARDIFKMIRYEEFSMLAVMVSYYEIYQGKLYDLMDDRKKLFAREDGQGNVVISGLKEIEVSTVDQLLNLVDVGSSVRSTGATGANIDSSRSHAITTICLKNRQKKMKMHGKFSFIDLAGSERGADTTDNDRTTRMEGAEINKSLLALKECIRAMDLEKRHLPFRGSKLTQVLKDSFVGNSYTVMIANVSPAGNCVEHTLNTLRYADRVKEMTSRSGSQPVKYEMLPSPPREVEAAAAGRQDPPALVHDDSYESKVMAVGLQEEEEEMNIVGDDPPNLARTHENLVFTILSEEDEIINLHRQLVAEMTEISEEEVRLIEDVDRPGSSVESYITQLDGLLRKKLNLIVSLRDRVATFKGTLQEEELLSMSVKKDKPSSSRFT